MEGILTIACFEHRRTLGLANDRNEARFQPSALASAQKSHENMQRLHIQFGYGFDSDDTAVLVTIMGTLISPVGEARPRIPRLQMEFFHESEFHRFGSIPRNGTGVMRDEFTLAIVTGVGVSEMA